MNDLLITLTSHNRLDYLKLLLTSLLNQTYSAWDLMIIDNGYDKPLTNKDNIITDPLLKKLVNKLMLNRTVQIKRFDTNIGKARARKVLLPNIKKAYEFVFDLDDDHYLDPDCILHLYNTIKNNPRIGAVGSSSPDFRKDSLTLVKEFRSSHKFNTIEVRNTPDGNRGVFLHRDVDYLWTKDNKLYTRPIKVSHCSQFMYRSKMVNPELLLGYSILAFTEETDLGLNIKKNNGDLYYQPNAINWHLFGEHGTRCIPKDERINMVYADVTLFLGTHFDYIKENQEEWGMISENEIEGPKVWFNERRGT